MSEKYKNGFKELEEMRQKWEAWEQYISVLSHSGEYRSREKDSSLWLSRDH